MENSLSQSEKKAALFSKVGLYGGVAALASMVGMASCFADYNMAGPALDATVVTGAKAGLGDAVATIQTTLNNQYLIEVAILFIGLAVVVGFVMHVLKGHRKI